MSSLTTSSSRNFDDAVCHALSQLGMSHLILKDEQKQSIRAAYDKRDVFMFLPTGFGKSICFHVLPFVVDYRLGLVDGQKKSSSSVVVVSPLVALMVDQVKSLRSRDVEAVVISSGSRGGSIVEKELCATEKSLESASLIFSSPEALRNTKWRKALEKPSVSCRVCAIVVDEAHCVSKW